MPRGSLKRMMTIDSSGVGIQRAMKGLGIDGRYPLEVDVGLSELRADVLHIVRHASQDRFRHFLGRVAALSPIALDFLNSLKIDHWHDADLQVRVLRDVCVPGYDGAVQPLVEQEISVGLIRTRA